MGVIPVTLGGARGDGSGGRNGVIFRHVAFVGVGADAGGVGHYVGHVRLFVDSVEQVRHWTLMCDFARKFIEMY